MIYLIGGPPRCGKSILARRLAEELKISWISVDTLESIVKAYTPLEKMAEHFPKNELRSATNFSNDLMYDKFSAEDICHAYVEQAKTSWKAISVLVECMIKDNEEIIIEGHQIHPELIKELTIKFGDDKIKAVILLKDNVESIVESARLSQENNDWFIDKTNDPKIHYKIAEMISIYSSYLRSEAKDNTVIAIDYREDFDKYLSSAKDILHRY